MKTTAIRAQKILLVDDSVDGLIVRRHVLQEAGFDIQIAGSGEEALTLLAATSFDVVVTDFRMPGMDGVELICHIRKSDPTARIVLLSGFVEPLGLTEQSTGADAVVAKNANEASHLVRSLRRLLNMAPQRKMPGRATSAGTNERRHGVGVARV